LIAVGAPGSVYLWVALGCALSVATGLFSAIVPSDSPLLWDDAYIFFRYVDNFLAGHGLTWNPGGERVEGYSSFLYVMLLSIPRAVGVSLHATAHVINIGLYVVTILLSVRLTKEALNGWRPVVFLGPLLVAANVSLSTVSRSGMESMLFAALIVVAMLLQARLAGDSGPRQQLISGIAFGLVGLTRPEGAGIYFVCCAVVALEHRKAVGRFFQENFWAQLLGFSLVVGSHLLFRLAYYGELLPNSALAKAGFSLHQFSTGWQFFAQFLGSFGGALVGLALFGWSVTPRCRVGNMLTAGLVTWVCYLASIGLNDWGLYYTVPVHLFSCLGAGLALAKLSSLAGFANRTWAGGTVAALTFVVLVVGSSFPARYFAPPPGDTKMVEGFVTIGDHLRRIAQPGDTLAVGACGAIPYYSGLVVYDTLGLNDKHIAHLPPNEKGWFAHSKGDGRYILDKQPTFMIPFPFLTERPYSGKTRLEKTFNEIFVLPEFKRDYEFKYDVVGGGLYFNYYRRK
jgi:arabinofuranosyltransferase